MCGITGFWGPGDLTDDSAGDIARRMRDRLAHRGPDDAGLWIDASQGIALGHRRLTIIDLSAAGHQPMASPSGRYRLVYNGEIYNHLTLREQHDRSGRHEWRGTSDTESLLAAIEEWGIDRTLQECTGMFALALWDRHTRSLTLARDRMGEKPLYYGWQGDSLLFGSELKALTEHPSFRGDVDPDAAPRFFQYGYIPTPWTIWKDISKLPPGSILHIRSFDDTTAEPTRFWSIASTIQEGRSAAARSDDEAIDALDQQLRTATRSQMVADVPLGAFLSGGIDSSTIVAMMQSQSTQRVKTFSIGFREEHYDEAKFAKAIAEHLGTDHTELYVSSQDAMEVVPELPSMFDEPFGDKSAIPTALVTRMARAHVTVALSGDGGDELFGGYTRYTHAKSLRTWRATRALPIPVRAIATRLMRSPVAGALDRMRRPAWALARRSPTHTSISEQAKLTADLAECADLAAYYRRMISHWYPPPTVTGWRQPDRPLVDEIHDASADPIHQMMAIDAVSYLLDDILVKVDRTAMDASLETRIPLLDHRVVELAWQLPASVKVRGGQGKWILRQVLDRYVPAELVERPKQGFSAPVDEWIRGPLREWAESLLAPSALASSGLLDPKPIRARWEQHLAGHHNWRDSLWLVLMWQSWWASDDERASKCR